MFGDAKSAGAAFFRLEALAKEKLTARTEKEVIGQLFNNSMTLATATATSTTTQTTPKPADTTDIHTPLQPVSVITFSGTGVSAEQGPAGKKRVREGAEESGGGDVSKLRKEEDGV